MLGLKVNNVSSRGPRLLQANADVLSTGTSCANLSVWSFNQNGNKFLKKLGDFVQAAAYVCQCCKILHDSDPRMLKDLFMRFFTQMIWNKIDCMRIFFCLLSQQVTTGSHTNISCSQYMTTLGHWSVFRIDEPLCGHTGFPPQRASNAESVSSHVRVTWHIF